MSSPLRSQRRPRIRRPLTCIYNFQPREKNNSELKSLKNLKPSKENIISTAISFWCNLATVATRSLVHIKREPKSRTTLYSKSRTILINGPYISSYVSVTPCTQLIIHAWRSFLVVKCASKRNKESTSPVTYFMNGSWIHVQRTSSQQAIFLSSHNRRRWMDVRRFAVCESIFISCELPVDRLGLVQILSPAWIDLFSTKV